MDASSSQQPVSSVFVASRLIKKQCGTGISGFRYLNMYLRFWFTFVCLVFVFCGLSGVDAAAVYVVH